VGKTTLSVGLASLYAAEGRETTVVDLDPQSNVAFLLGVDPLAIGSAALITGGGAEPQRAADHLSVYAGGPPLTESAVLNAFPYDLGDNLASLSADVVIIDCPPGHEHLDRMAMAAASIALT
jgi:chromosome partitioning protein